MRFEKMQSGGLSSATKAKPLPSGRTLIPHSPGHHLTKTGKVSHKPLAKDKPMTFVCVDGEGIDIDGEHRYVLLGIGEDQITNEEGLDWKECFEFLYKHFKPGTAYVGFYLGYDFTQMFKTLPEDRARLLLTKEGREKRKFRPKSPTAPVRGKPPHPVEYDGWQFDMLAMKRLRIRPKTCNCRNATCPCKGKAPWMYICDGGSFFQSSFLAVLKKWGENPPFTPEEYALIERGKENRENAKLDDDMLMYNRLENVVLSRIMGKLDEGLRNIGIHLTPSQWHGPGQAAQVWLDNQSAPTGEEIREKVPQWFQEAARMSYFGGWFEIFMHGHIPGETHEYDINSAYPYIIQTLPCLLHGTYSYGEGIPTVNPGDLCLVYARVWVPECLSRSTGFFVGSMLHRDDDGAIHRPDSTKGWYWWDEYRAAQASGFITRPSNRKGKRGPVPSISRWVKYEPCDCPPPVAKVAELYEHRLRIGKDTAAGKAAKLPINSLYGKFAQSVGEPKYGNAVYASRITSECRRIITEAIGSHPQGKAAVTMVATDAVYFLTPHPGLKESENLGDWTHNTKHNLTQFKPGVYWDDKSRKQIANSETPSFKSRGFKAADFAKQLAAVDQEFRQWDSGPLPHIDYLSGVDPMVWPGQLDWPKVVFTPSFVLITCLQALQRKNWSLAGTKPLGTELAHDSDPYKKRRSNAMYRWTTPDGRIIYRTEPLNMWNGLFANDGDGFMESTPYKKRFGDEDRWSDESLEAFGITPDGNINDICYWILFGGDM